MLDCFRSLGVAVTAFACSMACSTTPLGATDAELEHARSQAAAGARVYERDCAACHGARGEGLAGVPPVMGSGALPIHQRDAAAVRQYGSDARAWSESERGLLAGATRGAFHDARDVHGFLTRHMPKIRQTFAPPTPNEYWQVTTFLLVANGTDVPPSGLDATNAATVLVKP
jgi:hypothetical protein